MLCFGFSERKGPMAFHFLASREDWLSRTPDGRKVTRIEIARYALIAEGTENIINAYGPVRVGEKIVPIDGNNMFVALR